MSDLATPPTDASSASTLNGSSWLGNLLRDAVTGYVAVETVRNQKRTTDSVTTLDPVRVGATPQTSPAISAQTLYIAGGLLVASLLALLFIRRK